MAQKVPLPEIVAMVGKRTTGPANVMGNGLWVGRLPQYVTSH